MNTLDWIILGFLALGLLTGFIKGGIKQAFSLGGLVLGIICGTLLYKPFAAMLQGIFSSMSDKTAGIVAFIVILLLVPLVCGLVGALLSKLVHAASLGFLDRLLGAAFGLFKFMLILGLIIKLLNITGIEDSILDRGERKQSKLYVPVSEFSGFCLQWTWNKVQETVGDLVPDFQGDADQD